MHLIVYNVANLSYCTETLIPMLSSWKIKQIKLFRKLYVTYIPFFQIKTRQLTSEYSINEAILQ